ncbi:MAG: hypothetical protein P8R42_22725 [Candidatus Binatia bacterium]|nr:hypothetical protein [Candidatus Binatia bacterium]
MRSGAVIAAALAATLAAVAGIGCGKMGPPRLPQLAIPLEPQPVQVRNVADGIAVTFRRPREYRDGVALDDLGNFEISRSCAHAPGPIPVANIPVVDHGRLQKQSQITLVDFDPQPGQTCTYRVVAVTLDGYRSAPADSEPIKREIPLAVTP